MCGRFTLYATAGDLQLQFRFSDTRIEYRPRWNIAPSQEVLVITDKGGGREARYMRWGLIPSWAKDLAIGNRMINARAETLALKPAFRTAYRRRRCLVLADGFYEWQKTPTGKRPIHIRLRSGRPFAFAGLWESWTAPEGNPLLSCTIITTTPNELMAPIHDRMPVILSQEAEALWLDPLTEKADALQGLLVPYPPEEMEACPVSSMVNSPANDNPVLVLPTA